MLSASTKFLERADGTMRPINWALFISFARKLDTSADFFTVGVSTVGGNDIIKGTDNVLQIWDQYQYLDYSDRVVSMDWIQTYDPVYSVQSAMGDLVLDNHDEYLSADNFALPMRPMRIYAGFGNEITGDTELLPQFVGVNSDAPNLDYKSKTASYALLDFLSTLYNLPLNETVIMTNVTTDQALSALLQLLGISPTQFDLDPGFNTIPVVYFDPTTLFGDAAKQLMQAEMGRLFMSETGRITFKNRQSDATATPVWTFDTHNILDYSTKTTSNIINKVQITSQQLVVQPNQKYWESTLSQQSTEVLAGATTRITPTFADPCTSIDTPVLVTTTPTAPTTSYFMANTAPDGTGTVVTSGVSLNITKFATSAYLDFTNNNSFPVYITYVVLFAQPAKPADTLVVIQENDTSISQYGEHLEQLTNNFFGDETSMNSYALILINEFGGFDQLQTITVKGNPAIQLYDVVEVAYRKHSYIAVTGDTLTSIAAAYSMPLASLEDLNPGIGPTDALTDGQAIQLGILNELYKIVGKETDLKNPQLSQVLTLLPFQPVSYFTAGISLVGGNDIIAP